MPNPRKPISPELRRRIYERDGYRCRYCGSDVGVFHVDHVYPRSKGGEDSIRNYVTACDRCNRTKHDAVGIWPKPIRYFEYDEPLTSKYDLWGLLFLSMFLGTAYLSNLYSENAPFYAGFAIFFGICATAIGIKRTRGH